MSTEEEIAKLRRHYAPLIELELRAGISDLPDFIESLEDTILNEDLDEADAQALFVELKAHAEAVFSAHAHEEASWIERTMNDRIADALDDLAANGIVVDEDVSIRVSGGLHTSLTRDRDGRDGAEWMLMFSLDRVGDAIMAAGMSIRLPTNGTKNESSFERYDAETKSAQEIVRVLQHHAVPASWNEALRKIEVPTFPWQRRRTTRPPGRATPAPKAPPPAAPCPICNGKGWVVVGATQFPEVCTCRGGAPKPGPSGQGASVGSVAVAAPVPDQGATASTSFEPSLPARVTAIGRGVAVAALALLAARFWKHLPLGWSLVAGGATFVASGLVPLLRAADTLTLTASGLACRSSRKAWELPYDQISRAYRFADRWIFETHAPQRRFEFRLRGHDHHARAIIEALEAHTKTMSLAWTGTVALSRLL